MKPDDFESELQRHAIRSMPKEWREEILAVARARASVPSIGLNSVKHDRLGRFRIAAANLFSPNRWSWSAIAAAWALILFLQASASEPTRRSAARPSEVQQTAIHFDEQRKLLVEILNDSPAQAADRPKLKRPELRGQCNRELIFA